MSFKSATRYLWLLVLAVVLGSGAYMFWPLGGRVPERPISLAILDTGWNPKLWPSSAKPLTTEELARVHLDIKIQHQILGEFAGNGEDRHGHGTRLAGIVLQATRTTQVIPIQVTLHGTGVEPSDLVKAIRLAIGKGVKMILVSLGVAGSDELRLALNEAEHAGILVVAAVGVGLANPYEPDPVARLGVQSHPAVLTVGTAFEEGGAIHPERTENYGPEISLAYLQPEERALIPGDPKSQGSSFAAARIAGIIARAMEDRPSLRQRSAIQWKEKIRTVLDPIPQYWQSSEEWKEHPRGGAGLFVEPGSVGKL